MPDRKTPDSSSSSKYLFRFTPDEIAEMENILKETNNAIPPFKLFYSLSGKFSKSRVEQGLSQVRYDSVQNWFRKRRHMIRLAAKALSSVKSTEPSNPSSAADMEQSPMGDEQQNDGEEASGKSGSEEEISKGGTLVKGASGHIFPTISVSNSAEIVDHMDMQPHAAPILQKHLSEVDGVLSRLAKFKRVRPEANLISLNPHTDAANSSGVGLHETMHQAKLTLEKVAGMNLVDFRKFYQIHFNAAINFIVEKGFLSEIEKTELMLLQDRISKIVKENEQAREELSKCNSFEEKLTEVAGSADKIRKKAVIFEEKYNKFPHEMNIVSSKISELKAALVQAKGELEIMKGDQEDVANKLSELRQSLGSVNKQYKILKAEQGNMIKKRARIEETLEKSTEEWVQFTQSTGFTENKGGQ